MHHILQDLFVIIEEEVLILVCMHLAVHPHCVCCGILHGISKEHLADDQSVNAITLI